MNKILICDTEKEISAIDCSIAVSKYLEFLTYHVSQSQFKSVFIGQKNNILYTVFSLDGEFSSNWLLKKDSIVIFNYPIHTNNDVYLLLDSYSRDVIDMVLNLKFNLIKEHLINNLLPNNNCYIEINKKDVRTHQDILDTIVA